MADTAAAHDISFVSLTWNSEAYIRRCLDSVITQCSSEDLHYEFTVVDNGSMDGSVGVVDKYCARHPEKVHLMALDSNRGTTYTRNLALKLVRSPVVCILDSDTEFLSGSIRSVIDLLAAHPSLGIVAPRLLLPDGTVQHSVKRCPTIVDKLKKVPRILTGRNATRSDFYEAFPFNRCTLVETAISACWFLRTELLGEVGLLDEGIFYSPEDLDYSARVKKAGKEILYYPDLSLLHHTQQLSHSRPFSKLSISHAVGLFRFYRKHGGWLKRQSGEPCPWPVGAPVGDRSERERAGMQS
jgi:hypothetical protein